MHTKLEMSMIVLVTLKEKREIRIQKSILPPSKSLAGRRLTVAKTIEETRKYSVLNGVGKSIMPQHEMILARGPAKLKRASFL